MRWGAALHVGLVAGSGAACAVLISAGAAAPVGIALPSAAAAACVMWLERRAPFDPAWSADDGEGWRDVGLALTGLVVAEVVLWSAALAATRGVGLSGAWPHRLPLAAQLALYLLLVELLGYWSHRAMHKLGALWPLHRTHHSARRLYWLNSFRLHPADAALSTSCSLAWAAVCGVPEAVVACGATITTAHLWLQHSNAALGSEGLAPLLATAEFHRWHHVAAADEAQVNYGHLTGLWDWCFGTWRRGVPVAPLEIGVRA